MKARLFWGPITPVISKLRVNLPRVNIIVHYFFFFQENRDSGSHSFQIHFFFLRAKTLICDMPELFSRSALIFPWEQHGPCPEKNMRLTLEWCCQLCRNAQLGFLHAVSEAHKVCIDLEACHSHGYFRRQYIALAANWSWQKKPGC